jgi:hygromycin-B 7''-O-kinase
VTLIPAITSRDQYRSLRSDVALWLPAIQEICRQHHLPMAPLTRFADESTHIIFAVGDEFVVKLFAPFWPDYKAESLLLRHVSGRLPLATPRLMATGDLERWPYIVMTRLTGKTLGSVWPTVPHEEKKLVVRQLGQLMAALHALPLAGLEALQIDWPSFVARRSVDNATQQRQLGLSQPMVREIEQFRFEQTSAKPVLLHADLTRDQLMLNDASGAWQLTGLLDFGDAFIGHREYDFIAPAIDVTARRPELLRDMLLAYGYREQELNETFSRRLLGFLLLHHFCNWPRIIAELGEPAIASLEEMRLAVFQPA